MTTAVINTQDLDRVQGIISVSRLAELAGLSKQAIMAKVRRGSTLRVEEAEAIEAVLDRFGIEIREEKEMKGTGRGGG
jgi:hypothetical protein